MKRRQFFALGVLLMTAVSAASLAAQSPSDLVRNTAESMLSTLEARRAEIDRRPQLIYELVGRNLAPHFDFELITQSAVGSDWRKATPAQRQALVDAFREVLVRTYATALLKYSGQEIVYQTAKPGTREGTVIVPTQVRAPGAAAIPVDYRLHNKRGTWKVYDVVIENVSLISNYRGQFRSIIGRDGIDGLIKELRAKSRTAT
ncbi:MlaC/ttg2D family ABC transporter substrate-binding protein [Thiorhodovibrio frisius]|uniref:ABC-type transport system involved in resistance to organic solvents, auxiliary component n=1 Tax=Thiorhodovibrio frisius TaxID=631362 RepID=H8YZU5_9GAMM|nr:ABC transporter substrate-binding protein [Thiorhodovibrio frisius]EIC22222.1 ABC-type transport system involved in resistance to organic solvents, auxiliary component [Thiorhodovibrio frisius]WPL24516.1 putative phospholipid-binding protein MlaC precursor [Thiorhodovibrio frisius]